jgi:hypothetical protein
MSISQNFPNTRPSLNLNFARSKTLDPRITFTRTSTGTYVDESGFIRDAAADEPRFDHDPATGECLGLLIEEQRENRCTQSVNFGYSATSNTTETTVFNPDGTAAIRRVPLSTGNFHGASSNAANIDISSQAVGGTTDVTTSIFVRNYNNSNLRLLIGFAAFDATPTYRYFLMTINTANPTTLGIPSGVGWSNGFTKVDNYGNGWYRYTFGGRYTKAAGFNTITFVGEQIFSSTGQQFWYGDDVSGIYTWGKQIELGLFSTSYIPTSGSTVTRTPDNASMTGTNFSSWYNQSEGSIFCSANNNPGVTTSTSRIFYAFRNSASPSGNFIRKWIWNGNTGLLLNSIYTSDGGPIAAEFSTSLETGNKKTVISYKQNDFARSYNGSVPLTDGGGNTPVGINELQIGTNLSGHISQLLYYPTRLPNSQLQTLTK